MTNPAPVLPRATVVICVYTEKRWDDIVAAVGSVQAQDVRATEVLVVVDHNPALRERARGVFGENVRVLANAHRQGLSGARNTAVARIDGERPFPLARQGGDDLILDPETGQDRRYRLRPSSSSRGLVKSWRRWRPTRKRFRLA